MTWPWPRVKFQIDLWMSSHTYFASPRREQQTMYKLYVSMFLSSKVIYVTYSKTFIVDELWWPQYWPDSKMFDVKVVDLSTTYQMPFDVCRSDVCFFIWRGPIFDFFRLFMTILKVHDERNRMASVPSKSAGYFSRSDGGTNRPPPTS